MRTLTAHLTAILLFAHMVLGCCWHHAHAGHEPVFQACFESAAASEATLHRHGNCRHFAGEPRHSEHCQHNAPGQHEAPGQEPSHQDHPLGGPCCQEQDCQAVPQSAVQPHSPWLLSRPVADEETALRTPDGETLAANLAPLSFHTLRTHLVFGVLLI